jgi:glycosyltransferase involved in cell wall biosynthesis
MPLQKLDRTGPALLNYIAITPAKDEERYIERTLRSMTEQSHLPLQWILVDDGSSDQTCEIIQKYADAHPFIRLLRADTRTKRATGTAEITAFYRGFDLVRNDSFDCIVKLDADLSFEPDYFERIMAHFDQDPRLGVASGIYLEQHSENDWREVTMPSYHAAGASKVVRKACFEEIGGFIEKRGWDTVDEIRAISRDWRTGHFSELKMKHWKPEGTGMGLVRTCYMHGEIYYRTRGDELFFVLKFLRRLANAPIAIGGLAMLWGYVHAALKRLEPLVTPDEAVRYRHLLSKRIREIVSRFIPAF